ncbi:PRC-barrel domain-containing protein [Sulfitobacter sp. JB4-11]|uniref:PRC-barrel domain-containing protein n=1 Tax=Sulfitobacter rhodophyticola TaxID=3238304 RepID=UPI003513A362
MKRFLSTTAVLLTLSGAAYADAHSSGFGDVTAETGDMFASNLIGMRIYNSENQMENDAMVADGAEQEWDDIGEINDILISTDGDVRAVILGVGGFLGIGEHDVSVSMDTIKVVREEGDSNDTFLVVTTSKEVLENAPKFERNMDAEQTEASDMDHNNSMLVLVRPQVKREGYAEVETAKMQEMTAEDIQGSYVYGAKDETVGEIDRLIMADNGKVDRVVINVGGFLGLGEKPVEVTFDELQVLKSIDGDDFRIYIDSTEEKLEALPEYQG